MSYSSEGGVAVREMAPTWMSAPFWQKPHYTTYMGSTRMKAFKSLWMKVFRRIIISRLVVVDGSYDLDEDGQMYGTAKRFTLLLTSNNLDVIDAPGTRFMGFDPQDIEHIVHAERERAGHH